MAETDAKAEGKPDNRALARAVLSILSHADLDQHDNEISVNLPPSAGAVALEGDASRDAEELDASPDSNDCEP